MSIPPVSGLDVGVLLDRAEEAAPIEAIDAVAETLAEMLGAQELAFSDR